MITKIFSAEMIKNGYPVYPSVIVTIVNHWDGKKMIKRAYMNYLILGWNEDQSFAYDTIVAHFPSTFKSAEKYANKEADCLWHY